ncbi:MAG: uracil phosphoribosyltransferase [Bacteroidetes bacterium]|uniref:Uracil phosphoribosyltransferase n=1 Tax=Candidatus Cryptobacteroides excrementavium TaxID=2840759 RepID=A0A9D9J1L3_9BACT|nr:uracil phosphoribosyltransferase [Candidatus Cryptobacteroides excrementavium]
MKIINLGESNSVLNSFMAQMRDKDIQKDHMRFRRNLERVGEIFAYEISKVLDYSVKDVRTPLGIADIPTYDNSLVIATILRAGLPLHQGLLNFFDNAQNAFVAAYRKYDKGDDFHINIEYASSPDLSGKTLILADTMLATGASLEITYNRLRENGEPAHTHLVCPVSSIYAVEYIQRHLPSDKVTLWVAAIDEELTTHSYIVPGLGDAGDLAYGDKI